MVRGRPQTSRRLMSRESCNALRIVARSTSKMNMFIVRHIGQVPTSISRLALAGEGQLAPTILKTQSPYPLPDPMSHSPMHSRLSMLALIVLLPLDGRALANVPCGDLPPDVRSYLEAHSDWTLVTVERLTSDHQALWERYHHALCPGFASVDLDGNGKSAHALALLKRSNDVAFEKLVLIQRTRDHVQVQTLSGPDQVSWPPSLIARPFVVWRVGPGKSHDSTTGRNVVIKRDSIVYELMESSSVQYYESDGKIHSLTAAN